MKINHAKLKCYFFLGLLKTLLCISNYLIFPSLQAQIPAQNLRYNNINTLAQLPLISTITEKTALIHHIQQGLEDIPEQDHRFQQTKHYHQLVTQKQDSFLLVHSLGQMALMSTIIKDTLQYNIKGQNLSGKNSIETFKLQDHQHYLYSFADDIDNIYFKKQRRLHRQTGVYVEAIPKNRPIDLYTALGIYKDETGSRTFEAMRAKTKDFVENNSIEDFDGEAVYWIKLNIRGHERQRDTLAFFVENSHGFQTWQQIDAYWVHQNGQIVRQQTGSQLTKKQKSIPSYHNVLRFELAAAEQAVLYLRLEGVDTRRMPKYISLKATRQQDFLSHNEYQNHGGKFTHSNPFTPFDGNRIDVKTVYEETKGRLAIHDMAKNWDNLSKIYLYDAEVKPNKVFWTKIKLIGSPRFNGQHLFHISPYPFVGTDVFSFDYIDYYFQDKTGEFQHQQTGRQVPIAARSYQLWANFIKVEVPLDDTLELFIRMEGTNPRYIMPRLDFWHIDPHSVFPNQLTEATGYIIFYAILGIQFSFFLLLFFIERERLHLYFAILVVGIFFSFGFVDDNYRFFVPFIFWRNYHVELFFLGMFLSQLGFLKFTEAYFDYPKTSFWSKYFIPIFIILSLAVNMNGAWKFQYLDSGHYPANTSYHLLAIIFIGLGMVFSLMLGIIAPRNKNVSKKFFLLAFLPGILLVSLILLRSILGNFPELNFFFKWLPSIFAHYSISKLGIVLLLLLLALSMGYRTNRLKAEREKALRENVNAQKALIEKLQQTDQLQELDKLKTRFYTNITHEFRTPLTVILGINNQLETGDWVDKVSSKEKSRLAQGFNLIERNGKKLLSLINQLLDLSKLDTNNLKPHYQTKEVVSFVQYVGESFESLAEQKGVRLAIYSEIDQLVMDIDEDKLQQIIANLLSNAIKFTPARGKVILHLSQKDTQLFIKVKDTGEGISEEALPHIFDRFYQVDNASSRQGEGTGIGLALVQELVDLLDGTIEVTSTVGKGTTFLVVLPIEVTSRAEQSEKGDVISPRSSNDKTIQMLNKDLKHSPKIGLEMTSPFSLHSAQDVTSKPQLLITEDNPDVIFYIQSILAPHYQIEIAQDGQAGIDKALEQVPDIIISDVMMPKKNGFELVETLKQDERTSHIPIILLTAKATQQDKLAGLKYGADAYLMKPFDKEELFVRLEKLLEVRQALQRRYSTKAVTGLQSLLLNAPKTIEDIFLEKLHKVLEKNYEDSNFSIKDLAKAMQLSYHQFNRKLKALTDKTPALYFRSFRLHKAKELLLADNDLNVSEVAYEVGFDNPNYFSRAFSEEFGRSPNEVKR